jgi:hypothetical protein
VTGLHGRPDAAELVAAVREFLEGDVLASTEGRVQFHTRVAVNALRMVERELTEGPVMERAHTARLEALGVPDDEALSTAIRAGVFDERWDEVATAIYESVVEKLRVANPRHLEEDEAEG